MSYRRKLLEVLIQIALLPVAAFTSLLAFYFITIIGFFIGIGGYFLEIYILYKLKSFTPEEGASYNVAPSDNVTVSETFGGNYKVEVHHDDGSRSDMSGQEFGVGVMAFFALPLRIITLVLSIFALIIPPLKIKAKNNKGTFGSIVFDII